MEVLLYALDEWQIRKLASESADAAIEIGRVYGLPLSTTGVLRLDHKLEELVKELTT